MHSTAPLCHKSIEKGIDLVCSRVEICPPWKEKKTVYSEPLEEQPVWFSVTKVKVGINTAPLEAMDG
jgi:hypothetical protein